MESLLLIPVWGLVLDWTADILTVKTGMAPKNFKTGPQPSFPIILLSPLPLVNELERSFKCSRTLNKVTFEKSKPKGDPKEVQKV